MRDERIFRMNQMQAQNVALVYKQIQFLNARLLAYEVVLSSSWNILRAIWSPGWLQNKIDQEQVRLLAKHDEEVRKAAQKAKEEAQKPKLTIVNGAGSIKSAVVALVVFGLMSGCVTMQTHNERVRQARAEGFKQADLECIDLQKRLSVYIRDLQERLRKFNQVDKDGALIPLKKKWMGDTDTWEVDGGESWQK